MASQAVFVLPGDNIDSSHIPSHPKKPLRLGPGLRHVPPNDIVPTVAGQLITDRQKNAIRVENARGRVRTASVSTRHKKLELIVFSTPPVSVNSSSEPSSAALQRSST